MVNPIEVTSLRFSYHEKNLFSGMDWTVAPGDFWGVLGANGSGKTTLMKLLAGLVKIQEGSIHVFGKAIQNYAPKKLAQHLAFLAQENEMSFPYPVYEMVMMGRSPYLGFLQIPNQQDYEKVKAVMEETDTWNLRDQDIRSLSGGEKERVLLARCLAQETNLFILDEPTTYMDVKHQFATYELLRKLHRDKKMTVIAVLHDLNLAYQVCDHVLLLNQNGKLSLGKTQDVMTEENLSSAYSVEIEMTKYQNHAFFMPLAVS